MATLISVLRLLFAVMDPLVEILELSVLHDFLMALTRLHVLKDDRDQLDLGLLVVIVLLNGMLKHLDYSEDEVPGIRLATSEDLRFLKIVYGMPGLKVDLDFSESLDLLIMLRH